MTAPNAGRRSRSSAAVADRHAQIEMCRYPDKYWAGVGAPLGSVASVPVGGARPLRHCRTCLLEQEKTDDESFFLTHVAQELTDALESAKSYE